MNRQIISVLTLVFACAMAIPTMAQPGPGQGPGPGPQQGPPPGDQPGQPGQPGQFRQPGQTGQPGQPGMPGRGGGGPLQPLQARPPQAPELQKFDVLRNYIDVVDRFTKMSSDATAAGVAAVVSATDILRQRGPDSAIAYLTKTLPEVKSPAVQRAIRIQLADLYRQSGQADKALEQLDVLMKGPGTASP